MPVPVGDLHTSQQRAANPSFPNKTLDAGKLTLVFTVRHKTDRAKVLKEHRLVCMPTSFDMQTEGRSQLYYTKEGIFVDMPQRNAIGITVFSISGHTLYRGLTKATESTPVPVVMPELLGGAQGSQHTPVALTSEVDGAAAIKDLQDTIRRYFFPNDDGAEATTETPEASPGDLQLEFKNLNAPTSASDNVGLMGWIIHPHRGLVTLRQDASKPFLWSYQFSFAGLERLPEAPVEDPFVGTFSAKDSLHTSVLEKLDAFDVQGPIIAEAFEGMPGAIQPVALPSVANMPQPAHWTTPIKTFTGEVGRLANATRDFLGGVTSKINYALYAPQRLLQEGANLLGLPKHSVQTLGRTAQGLLQTLMPGTMGSSIGKALAGTTLQAGINDALRLAINGEPPQTIRLGSHTNNGQAIAAAIQQATRQLIPLFSGNASGYQQATAKYDPSHGRFEIHSGTFGSSAASVQVLANTVLGLMPRQAGARAIDTNDASGILGLGLSNGGLEQQGSSDPLPAMALLRDVMLACIRLEAFPEFFADTLPEQVTALQRQQPVWVKDAQVDGEHQMSYVMLTPGDSLQSVAARAGVAWETVALANHLQYPYVMDGPATMVTGRVNVTGQIQALTDTTQSWIVQQWQGQRVDLIRGEGAGQSRQILANNQSTLHLDRPWTVLPNANTLYAIRLIANPFVLTSTATGGATRMLMDTSLHLVPESQRGYELRILSGTGAGQRRRIEEHTPDTYVVEDPWDVVPGAGVLYAVITPQAPVRRRVLLLGDPVAIPRPTRLVRPRQVRAPLQDTATITGQAMSQDTKLFGTDLVFAQGDLVIDTMRQDLATVTGLPNVRQAVLNLLNLSLGELEYAPTLGSYLQEHLGRMATLPSEMELLHSVERTVRQDPRIARMGPTQLLARAGVVEVGFQAVTISGETVDRIAIR